MDRVEIVCTSSSSSITLYARAQLREGRQRTGPIRVFLQSMDIASLDDMKLKKPAILSGPNHKEARDSWKLGDATGQAVFMAENHEITPSLRCATVAKW